MSKQTHFSATANLITLYVDWGIVVSLSGVEGWRQRYMHIKDHRQRRRIYPLTS